jgi:hypothetical protein
MSEKFKIFSGKFPCKKCNEEVTSLRLWTESADLTWMCSEKHLSRVPLIMTRKDFERKSGK